MNKTPKWIIGSLLVVGIFVLGVVVGGINSSYAKGSLPGLLRSKVTGYFQFYFQESQRAHFFAKFAERGAGVGPVKFEILNRGGTVVREVCTYSATTIGYGCSWDGKDASGTFSPVGMYRFKVSYGSSYSGTLYSEFFESAYAP